MLKSLLIVFGSHIDVLWCEIDYRIIGKIISPEAYLRFDVFASCIRNYYNVSLDLPLVVYHPLQHIIYITYMYDCMDECETRRVMVMMNDLLCNSALFFFFSFKQSVLLNYSCSHFQAHCVCRYFVGAIPISQKRCILFAVGIRSYRSTDQIVEAAYLSIFFSYNIYSRKIYFCRSLFPFVQQAAQIICWLYTKSGTL